MSQPGFAGNKRIVDINGDAGLFVSILAQSTVRRLVIEESTLTSAGVANTLQGILQYKIPNDNTTLGFTTIFTAVGGQTEAAEGTVVPPKIELGSIIGQRMEAGEIIGQVGQPYPGGTPAANTTMVMLRSGTATGTSVIVTEYN
jgi:hypothetical protein